MVKNAFVYVSALIINEFFFSNTSTTLFSTLGPYVMNAFVYMRTLNLQGVPFIWSVYYREGLL